MLVVRASIYCTLDSRPELQCSIDQGLVPAVKHQRRKVQGNALTGRRGKRAARRTGVQDGGGWEGGGKLQGRTYTHTKLMIKKNRYFINDDIHICIFHPTITDFHK